MRTGLQPGGSGLFRDTAWNAALNAAAAGLSAFLLLLASHWAGAYWCGVVALGLAMSQQLFTLGHFTMGWYQASDTVEKHSFGDYVAAKTVTVGAMLLAGAAWLAAGGFGRDKALAFGGLLLYQASDAFANAFFGRYQQKGRLDVACRVRLAKIAAFAATYAVVLRATGRPPAALWAGAAVHAGLFFALDVPLLGQFGQLERCWPGRAAFAVLWACLPLAANSFLMMYLNNGPRFAVDAAMGEETLAAYSALFMVSFGVSVCGDFLMNPQVTRLAEALRAGDGGKARRIVVRQAGVIAGLGALALSAGAVAGIPVLSWLFGLDLSGNGRVLEVLLAGGVLVAYYQLAQTVLVVVRRQAWVAPGMVLAALAVFAAARPLVGRWGLWGAAWSYFGAVAVLAVCTGGAAAWHFCGALARERAAA